MDFQSLNLLIIDDEESFGKALSEFFRRKGLKVDWCMSPKQAEQKLALKNYDFILLDCMLPQKNGLEFAQEIYEKFKQKPQLILMSGILNDVVFVEQAKKTPGVIEFLSKPFEFEQIEIILQREVSDTAFFKGFDQFFHESPNEASVKHLLKDTEHLSGLDLPRLLAICRRSKLSGVLQLTNSQRESSFIHYFEGKIQKVITPDKNSFFGVLLTSHGYASMDEIAAGLSQTSEKPLGQRLFEMNSISPHAIRIVQCEQMSIRLSQLILSANYFLDFSDEVEESADGIAIESSQFLVFLSDWIPSKLSYKWLRKHYEPFFDCSFELSSDAIEQLNDENDFQRMTKSYLQQIPKSGNFKELIEEHSKNTFNFHSLYYLLNTGALTLQEPASPEDNSGLEQRLLSLKKRFGAENYYEILNIDTFAPPPAIEKAYLAMAQSVHPDRIPQSANQELHDLAKEVFQNLGAAKSTLTDAGKRSVYDFEIQNGSTEDIMKAERLFEQGVQYINRNDHVKALTVFKELVQMKSFSDESYIYYSWAVLKTTESTAIPPKKRLEAAEFVKALLMKVPQEIKHDARYFYVRGLYYKRTNQKDKALRRFRQSYHLDPEFKQAASEIAKLSRQKSPDSIFDKLKKIAGF